MTTQEAIDFIKVGHCDDVLYGKLYDEAVEMAIRSLEGWEKVKEEIKSLSNSFYFSMEFDLSKGLDMALESINKHLQEVEEK